MGGPGMRNPSATRPQGLGPAFLKRPPCRSGAKKSKKKQKSKSSRTLARTRGRTRACERTVQVALSCVCSLQVASGLESLWARREKKRSTAGKTKKIKPAGEPLIKTKA